MRCVAALLIGVTIVSLDATSEAYAQACFGPVEFARLSRIQQQLKPANYQSGLEYQLAQAQVDVESAKAREFTAKTPENSVARQRAESRVRGLQDTVRKLEAEMKHLASLPPCPSRATAQTKGTSAPPAQGGGMGGYRPDGALH
jgi:hypothetical protein